MDRDREDKLSTMKPFVLSLSKHERLGHPPFDKLRVNGLLSLSEEEDIPIPLLR